MSSKARKWRNSKKQNAKLADKPTSPIAVSTIVSVQDRHTPAEGNISNINQLGSDKPRHLKVLAVPTVIILSSLLIASVFTYSSHLNLDLNRAFQINDTVLTAPTNGLANSVAFKDANGNRLVITSIATMHDQVLPNQASEKMFANSKTISQMKAELKQLDLDKWALMSKLPPGVFRYNLNLVNFTNSPSNLKKMSFFLISSGDGNTNKILPGEVFPLAQNVSIDDLPGIVSNTTIEFHLEQPLSDLQMIPKIYDSNGVLVSQATGTIQIRPTLWTRGVLFMASWAFLLAVVLLINKTLMVGPEVREVFTKLYPKAEK